MRRALLNVVRPLAPLCNRHMAVTRRLACRGHLSQWEEEKPLAHPGEDLQKKSNMMEEKFRKADNLISKIPHTHEHGHILTEAKYKRHRDEDLEDDVDDDFNDNLDDVPDAIIWQRLVIYYRRQEYQRREEIAKKTRAQLVLVKVKERLKAA